MGSHIECRDCGFVLRSESDSEPRPKRVDACPDCDGTEFRFPERRRDGTGSGFVAVRPPR